MRNFKKTLLSLALVVSSVFCAPAQAIQTTLPADGYLGNPSITTSNFEQGVEDVDSVIMEMLGGHSEKAATGLVSDTLTPTVDYAVYPLNPESGTADNLATISSTSARDGAVIACRNFNAANSISITAAGNIHTADGKVFVLNNTGDYIAFVYRAGSAGWYELFRCERNKIYCLPGDQPEVSATIASGMLQLTQASTKVEGEGSASDNLDGLSSTVLGNIAIIRCTNASHIISVRNNQTVTAGFYTILTADGNTATLDSLNKYLILHRDVAGTSWREIARGGFPLPLTMPEQCRLYPISGSPAQDSTSGANTLYVGPYQGNLVSVSDSTGTNFTAYPLAETVVPNNADVFRIRDVFLYNNSGTIACETNPWDSGGQVSGSITGVSLANPCVLTAANSLSGGEMLWISGITGTVGTDSKRGLNAKLFKCISATSTTITLETGADTTSLAYTSGGTWIKVPTSRTDALTLSNGVYLKNSDKTRLYVGTIIVGGTPGTGFYKDDYLDRNVWNYFNRLPKVLYNTYGGTVSHTYTTATIRPFDTSTSSLIFGTRFNFVIGIDEDPVSFSAQQTVASSAANGLAQAFIAIDSMSAGSNALGMEQTTQVANIKNTVTASTTYIGGSQPNSHAGIGAHFAQYQEKATGGTVMTWYSGTSSDVQYINMYGRF